MRIGELAAQSGVPTSTIRFYEKRGLLPEAKLTDLRTECTELCNIVGQSIVTAKHNAKKK